MGIMAAERMEVKNSYQGLMNELLEEYGLSPIEAKALVKRVEQFKEEQQNGARSKLAASRPAKGTDPSKK